MGGKCGWPSDDPPPPPAPTPLPPTPPPAPTPVPVPGQPHYEKPPCLNDDEIAANIDGVDGQTCVAKCDASGGCPMAAHQGRNALWSNSQLVCACTQTPTLKNHRCP